MALHKSEVKIKLYVIRACIFPTTIHGCETWILNKNITKRVNTFENKCYGEILRVSWTKHRTTQSKTDELEVTSGTLLGFFLKPKLNYFGHIKGHQTLEKLIPEGKGKRNRGRPKIYCANDVKDWVGQVSGEWDEQQKIG